MNQNNGGDVGAFLAGFVIGGLVGAAAALILAPQSGEEMRARLTNRGAAMRPMAFGSAVSEAANETQPRIVLDDGKRKASGPMDGVRHSPN